MRGLRPLYLVLLLLFAVAMLLFAAHPIWDVDVFWHIVAGRWIVAHRALPHEDLFSAVDPSRPWVTFQWLYEVLCAGADRVGGLLVVRWFHALVATAALVWVALAVARDRRDAPLLGLVSAVLLAFLFADRLRVRPDLFNLFFVAIVLPVLWQDRLRRSHLVVLALVAGVWANVHAGGALLAPVLVGARLGGRFVERLWCPGVTPGALWHESRVDGAALLLVVLVMLPMPGFLRGTYQAFFMLGPSEAFIPEWMTTWEFMLDHAATLHEWVAALLPLSGLLLLLCRGAWQWRRTGAMDGLVRDLALSLPLVFLAMRHVRFLWLGGLLFVLLLRRVPAHRVKPVLLAGLVVFAVDVHYHLYRLNTGPGALLTGLARDLEPGGFPEAAADALVAGQFEGRILNHAPWGGYLLYRLYPRGRVFTDGRGNFGRVETRLLESWDRPRHRRAAIRAAWQQAPFEAIVHPAPFPFQDGDCLEWIRVWHDPVATVYVRADDAGAVRRIKALGPLLPEGRGYGAAESCSLHRAFTRASAARRLAAGERIWERARLAARLASGDETARLPFAALFYDLGDFGRVCALLAGMESAEALFLRAMALLGRGERGRARAVLLQLTTGGAGRDLSPSARAIVRHLLRQ